MRLNYFYLTLLFTLVINSYACDINGKTGILMENDLNISVNTKSIRSTMTEERFNKIIDLADKHYKPIVERAGAKLIWDHKWQDGTVNAFARQKTTKDWVIILYGGLARHELINDDSFALVICHELGHHLGGAPKRSSWASSEGQSDYFATLKCFKRIFEEENNIEIVNNMTIPQLVTQKCSNSYTLENDRALCKRAIMAGKKLTDFFVSLKKHDKKKVEISTPDLSTVKVTNQSYPSEQCRLDTYLQGTLCSRSIEKKVSNSDETEGTCNRIENMDVGVRPLCWFKPTI